MRWLPLFLALPLAGCVAPSAPLGSSSLPVPSLEGLAEGLPCEVDEVGPLTSASFRELAVLDLAETSGRHLSSDLLGDLLLLSRVDTGGFDVIDVRDPSDPRFVGNFTDAPAPGLDVKIAPGGRDALISSLGGIVVVDLLDPSKPVKESEWTFPQDPLGSMSQAHTVRPARIGDRDYVFVASQEDTGLWILELTGPPGQRQLELLATYLPFTNGPIGPHDSWFTYDEDLRKPLLYVANGFVGWRALDVSDPASPQLLGMGLPLDPHPSYHHTVLATKLDGRRLVISVSEVGANGLKVWDATDLRAPRLLATWASQPVPTGPQHDFQVVGDKLVMAHYSEGAYVFNLSALPDLPLPGAWQPMAHFAIGARGANLLGFVGLTDVAVKDGLVLFTDLEVGLRAVAFGCFAPGDAGFTSDA